MKKVWWKIEHEKDFRYNICDYPQDTQISQYSLSRREIQKMLKSCLTSYCTLERRFSSNDVEIKNPSLLAFPLPLSYHVLRFIHFICRNAHHLCIGRFFSLSPPTTVEMFQKILHMKSAKICLRRWKFPSTNEKHIKYLSSVNKRILLDRLEFSHAFI